MTTKFSFNDTVAFKTNWRLNALKKLLKIYKLLFYSTNGFNDKIYSKQIGWEAIFAVKKKTHMIKTYNNNV